MPQIPTCHPAEKHYARGLCEKCWRREYQRARHGGLSPSQKKKRLKKMREYWASYERE